MKNGIVVDAINLVDVEIPYPIALTKFCFVNDVDATRSRFRRALGLDGTYFKRNVDFTYARVAENLRARGAHFTYPGRLVKNELTGGNEVTGVVFSAMNVAGTISLRNAVFAGPVDFSLTRVRGDFEADKTRFTNETHVALPQNDARASFDGMTIEGTMLFRYATFRGPADFGRTIVGRDLRFDNAQFLYSGSDTAYSFDLMRVGGRGRFRKAVFKGAVSLSGARFTTLNFDQTCWPRDPDKRCAPPGNPPTPPGFRTPIQLNGVTYQDITMGPATAARPWGAILSLLSKADYDASLYRDFEGMLQRQGLTNGASEVYVSGRSRERRDGGLQALAKAWNWILEVFIGYGRHPEYALLWSLAIVIVCAGFFPRLWMVPITEGRPVPSAPQDGNDNRLTFMTWAQNMSMVFLGPYLSQTLFAFSAKPRRGSEESRSQPHGLGDKPYSSFWYSLDLFAPVIDLGIAKTWMPNPETHPGLVRLMHIQRILGWLLVPLGVAAVTGLVR